MNMVALDILNRGRKGEAGEGEERAAPTNQPPKGVDEPEEEVEDMTPRDKPNSNTVGIFAIFLTLVVQTAAIAFWAGGISSRQTNFDQNIEKLDQRLQYIQTQNEVSAKAYAKIEGRLDAIEK